MYQEIPHQPLTMSHLHQLDREALSPFCTRKLTTPETTMCLLYQRTPWISYLPWTASIQFGLGNEPISSLSGPDRQTRTPQPFAISRPHKSHYVLFQYVTCSHRLQPGLEIIRWHVKTFHPILFFAHYHWAHVSLASRQDGHKGEWLWSHLCNRQLVPVPAMSCTCLHAQSWKSRGTSCKALFTFIQSSLVQRRMGAESAS